MYYRLLFFVVLSFTSIFGFAQEPYAVLSADKSSLTFYYDELRTSRSETTFSLNSEMNSPAWSANGGTVTHVTFDSSFANARPKSCYHWFNGMVKLVSVSGMQYLNTSEATNMIGMFCECASLESIDLSAMDTGASTNLFSMFEECSSLRRLDLSNFNTSHVINMMCMFYKCTSLEFLDISGFDTSNVRSMYNMFSGCSRLKALDVSGFNTSLVTRMNGMFNDCMTLESLDVSGFDTSLSTTFSDMFAGCSNLKSLNVSNFKTSKCSFFYRMFSGCGSLTSLDVSGFDTSKATEMFGMFEECSSLTTLDVSGFDFSGVSNLRGLFNGCSSLMSLLFGTPDTSHVTDMGNMFRNCSSLSAIDLTGFDTSHVKQFDGMFEGCSKLSDIDVKLVNTASAVSTVRMFYGCEAFNSMDLTHFDFSKVSLSSEMLGHCSSLEVLSLPASSSGLLDNAFIGVGESQPCLLKAPADLSFESTDYAEGCFRWKEGLFRFETTEGIAFTGEADLAIVGKKTGLRIALPNDGNSYHDFEFSICLPSGIQLYKEDYQHEYTVSDDYPGVTLKITQINDSIYRVAAHTGGLVVSGGETPLIYLGITASPECRGQLLTGHIKDGFLSKEQCYDTTAPDSSFTIEVSPYFTGDVNTDGYVNMNDITILINTILGKTTDAIPLPFMDVNDDGYVNMSDVTQVINIILGK